MNLRFRSKIVILFALLSVIFIVIQGCLLAFLKTSWFVSSLVSVFASILLAYFLSKILIEPITRITQMVAGMGLGLPTGYIFPEDELSNLLKVIDGTASQLRRNIEEISQEKEYLQAILKGMAEGILVVDPRDRVRMMNEALRNLLSLPANGTDKSPLEIIRNVQLESSIHAAIQDGKSSAFEMDATFASNKTLEVNVVPIHGSPDKTGGDQRVNGVIAVFHDITRLKELERIRQDFVANVSHELRTPLTTIKGYAETLLEGALKEDVALQFLQIIKKHTDRLTKLVEDLLILSKVESKEFQLKLESFSLQELIEDAFGFMEEAADRKRISLSCQKPPSPLFIQGDRKYLEQVLINLLDNAIKYGREGGQVVVSSIRRDEKETLISVQDDGVGIPKQDLRRIFERFYRVDKEGPRNWGGPALDFPLSNILFRPMAVESGLKVNPRRGLPFISPCQPLVSHKLFDTTHPHIYPSCHSLALLLT